MENGLKGGARLVTDILAEGVSQKLEANREATLIQATGKGQRGKAGGGGIADIGAGQGQNIFFYPVDDEFIISNGHCGKRQRGKEKQVHLFTEQGAELFPQPPAVPLCVNIGGSGDELSGLKENPYVISVIQWACPQIFLMERGGLHIADGGPCFGHQLQAVHAAFHDFGSQAAEGLQRTLYCGNNSGLIFLEQHLWQNADTKALHTAVNGPGEIVAGALGG